MSVPPLFKNFGKSIKDLLEKKFDYNRELRVKTTTQSGVTFETVGRATKTQDFSGAGKATYKRSDFGTFEVELDTVGKAKWSVENDQARKGLVVKVSGDQDPNGSLDVSWRQEHLAASGTLNLAPSGPNVESSVALGLDSLSVGGAVKYNINSQKVSDYSLGADYSKRDYSATVKATDSANKVAVSYIHNLNADVQLGGQFNYNLASVDKLDTLLTVVGSFVLDRDTTVKAKVNNNLIVSTALEQRIQNPKVKYGIAADFNAQAGKTVPDRFGFTLALGDS